MKDKLKIWCVLRNTNSGYDGDQETSLDKVFFSKFLAEQYVRNEPFQSNDRKYKDTYYFHIVEKEIIGENNEQVCPDCGGKVTDDGYTIDPDKCCSTCKMD